MSADIVPLKRRPRDDLVWVCNCGCTTHYHHDNGNVECGACSKIASVSNDGWRVKLPPAAPDETRALDAASFKISFLNNADGFLRRTLKDQPETVCAMVVVYGDGSLSTWRDDDRAPDGREWMIARLREAIARLE